MLFTCTVQSNPISSIDWYHDGIKIIHNDNVNHHAISHSNNEFTDALTILAVNKSDEGNYHCIATNEIFNISYNDSTVFILTIINIDHETNSSTSGI